MYQETQNCFLQSRQKHFKSAHNHEFDENEINNLFNKKFRFRFNSDWTLPKHGTWFSVPPWSDKELDTMKSRLNFNKSQLNDFNIEDWSCHTRRRNPAGEVCWKIRCLINPEFLTQAWTKFYECAQTYNIVPQQAVTSGKMVSLHLCEAPGAFITSLNHYLKCQHPDIEWQWLASTLNPYHEGNSPSNMISDDRFMFHTLQHWYFGTDSTGNLMDWGNSQAIIERAKSKGNVLLVTADGSIDCLQRPDAQEEVTSPLHYCEIVTALQTLSEGGTLIFKLFTMFEHATVNLMYLVNNLFNEVNIYKPVTSRQGNSEVYAICLDFKGSDILEPYIPILRSGYGTELYMKTSLFPLEDLPKDFLDQVKECADYFCSIQCQVINSNLQAYLMQNNFGLQIDMKRVRNVVAAEFLRHYNLRPLTYDKEVLNGLLHEEDQKVNTNPRYHRGSYSERKLYEVMSLKEKCKNLSLYLETDIFLNRYIFINEQVRWVALFDGSCDLTLDFTYGKPLDKVHSSKFIFVPIFKFYQQILEETAFRDIIVNIEKNQKSRNIEDLHYLQCNTHGWKLVALPEFDYSEDYAVYEKRCFQSLLETVSGLSLGDSLVLRNFNTLTHFNISVLFILCKLCFERIGLTIRDGIVLNKLVNKHGIKHLTIVENECKKVKSRMQDILSTLPVHVTNSEDFFNNIIFYNNTFYKNKCKEYLCGIEGRI